MRLLLSFLFFIILVTMVTPVFIDHSKCSIEYIRDIVSNACSRVEDYPRKTRAADRADEASDEEVHRLSPQEELVLSELRALLPQNSSLDLIYERAPKVRRARGVDDHYDKYFKYCCENMDWCEKLDCPH